MVIGFAVRAKPVLPKEPGLGRIVLGLPPQETAQRDVAEATATVPSLTVQKLPISPFEGRQLCPSNKTSACSATRPRSDLEPA